MVHGNRPAPPDTGSGSVCVTSALAVGENNVRSTCLSLLVSDPVVLLPAALPVSGSPS